MPRVLPLNGKDVEIGKDVNFIPPQGPTKNIINRKELNEAFGRFQGFSSPESIDFEKLDEISGAQIGNNQLFLAVVPWVNYYQALYFRLLSQNEEFLHPSSKQEHGQEKENPVPTAIDPYYGMTVQFPRDKYPSWSDFKKLHKNLRDKISPPNADGEYRSHPLSFFSAWGFWRYFTCQQLDVKQFSVDQKNTRGVELVLWLKKIGEVEASRAVKLDRKISNTGGPLLLSKPPREQACNFCLGCAQNLSQNDAPEARRLSWEHEHTRPQVLGGKDGIDSASMCYLHNRIKNTNPLYDLLTMYNILTCGDLLF